MKGASEQRRLVLEDCLAELRRTRAKLRETGAGGVYADLADRHDECVELATALAETERERTSVLEDAVTECTELRRAQGPGSWGDRTDDRLDEAISDVHHALTDRESDLDDAFRNLIGDIRELRTMSEALLVTREVLGDETDDRPVERVVENVEISIEDFVANRSEFDFS
jgi:hypothetical protein